MTNIDLCGIAQLLRTLIEQKKTTEREARRILARIAAQTGAGCGGFLIWFDSPKGAVC